MGVFSGFFLLDENVTLILCDNLLFQSINRINSACKISFDHRAREQVLIPGSALLHILEEFLGVFREWVNLSR